MPDSVNVFFARGYELGKANCTRYGGKNIAARMQIAVLTFSQKYTQNQDNEDDFTAGFMQGIDDGLEEKQRAR